MDRKHQTPLDELTNLVGEFLEVSVALLLSVRGIYPPEIFERRRYLNVPVQWVRHPELRQYINSAISSAMPWIQNGMVEQFAVVFLDKNNKVVEKFTFQLQIHQENAGQLSHAEVEYALRAFFLKLSVSKPLMRTLPPESRWEILVYTKKLPGDADGKAHFWVPAETKLWDKPPLLTPIKSMNSKPLAVQLYIEHPS